MAELYSLPALLRRRRAIEVPISPRLTGDPLVHDREEDVTRNHAAGSVLSGDAARELGGGRRASERAVRQLPAPATAAAAIGAETASL